MINDYDYVFYTPTEEDWKQEVKAGNTVRSMIDWIEAVKEQLQNAKEEAVNRFVAAFDEETLLTLLPENPEPGVYTVGLTATDSCEELLTAAFDDEKAAEEFNNTVMETKFKTQCPTN